MSFRYWIFQFLLRKVQTPSIAEASDTLDIVLEPQQRSKITCLKKNIYMEYSKPKARNKLTICNQVCEHILATSCDWIVSISKNISYFVQIWPAAPHSSMFALYTLWGVLTSQKKKKKSGHVKKILRYELDMQTQKTSYLCATGTVLILWKKSHYFLKYCHHNFWRPDDFHSTHCTIE